MRGPLINHCCRCLIALGLALGLGSCAITRPDGTRLSPRSDAFADYVETVFRRQNELASDLAFALDEADPDGPRYRELEAIEIELETACRSLNEMARQRRAGEAVGGLSALRRARQAPDCERAYEKGVGVLGPGDSG